ncbi:hypothetical protein SGFS_008380 [Streptomyces graminofaciens]|uniref:HTH cro/C1-type domain-containing protein n=1 Tax=Streptomyces graminofaciens TaxID=68212 RepID=A0ABN5V991_9ACTN|nr:hypothetical protein SGFS_008380 [Streptomyces graminofaciens]
MGFPPSPSKVAAMWGGTPVTVRLDDLDKICAALACTVADLMEAEPVATAAGQGLSSNLHAPPTLESARARGTPTPPCGPPSGRTTGI